MWADFSTQMPSVSYHEWAHFQCSIVLIMNMSSIKCECVILPDISSENAENIWLISPFMFFSWVESFGCEGLGILLDILEKLIKRKT